MFWRKKTPRPEDVELVKQIHGLSLKLSQAIERLEALEAAHERLRGRFYAKNGHVAASKGDILREFGYVPGKPAPHT